MPHNLLLVPYNMHLTSFSTSLLSTLLLKYRSGHATELLSAYRMISNLGLAPNSSSKNLFCLVNYLGGLFCLGDESL